LAATSLRSDIRLASSIHTSLTETDESEANTSSRLLLRVGEQTCCINPNASMTAARPGSTDDESAPGQLRSLQTIRRSVMDLTVDRKSANSL